MYETFYGLKEKPFSLFPDHRFLYLNRRYQLALSLLEFGVLNQNGMILLTGDPGTGKTTLLHKILSTIDPGVTVGTLTFTHDKGQSLLPWVLQAFGLQANGGHVTDHFQVFSAFLHTKVQESQGMLLVVDEAQNLDADKLEELRLLFNLNDRPGTVLQILLAGHTQLRERLQDPQLQAFVQRIGTDFSLEPFSREDTQAYILHRVQAVGGPAALFSDAACHLVYRCTQGNPRLINQLCETSLLYGFSGQLPSISEGIVADAAKDRLKGGLLPLSPIEDTPVPLEHQSPPEPIAAEPVSSQLSPSSFVGETGASHAGVAHRHWDAAIQLKEQGWYLEAIRSLKQVAGHPTYHRQGWFQVGQCYLALGRPADAIEAFHMALGDSPNRSKESAPIHLAIGQALATLGRNEEATRHYDLARFTDLDGAERENHSSHSSSWQSSHQTDPHRFSQMWWIHTVRRWWSKLHPSFLR
ncbi:AAA family ATPase [uncultured Nitrospira sp.]|uniref:ExeA family protein n=1 Tax=uncultured Nitrospira sp. TaxID=157176 RepID=UPI0031406B79